MKRLHIALLALLTCHVVHADTVLVFNEIMYHPATNEPAAEWVEFYNQMAVDVDVSHWEITGGIDFTFPDGTVVPGGGYIVVAINPAALMTQTGLTGVLGPFTGRLSNNADTLRLRNNSRREVDEINYRVGGQWPVAPDGSGVSLAKKARDTASGPAANWTWSEQKGGTPGQANFAFLDSVPEPVELVSNDDVWVFEDSGVDLGVAWSGPGFDDSGWGSGTGWFYHGTVSATEPRPLTSIFNSGVDSSGTVLSPGASDPHFVLTQAAQGTVGAQATVTSNHPAWAANDDVSSWIGVVSVGTTSIAGGTYGYRTSFNLDGVLLDTVEVRFRAAIDNVMNNVMLNGVPQGITHTGFSSFSPQFTLNTGFQEGENTLEFITANEGAGPGAFRVELEGTVDQVLTNTALAVGPNTHYFRRNFNYQGDPSNAELTLNALVDDGAVFYLNGVEIARLNMPGGAVLFATPASVDVLNPTETAFVVTKPMSLLEGDNVLAVEIHQATGGTGDMLFSASMFATALPPAPLPLALNEVAGVTNETFFVEMANLDTNEFSLDGYVLVRDGLTNQSFVFGASHVIPSSGYLAVTGAELGFVPDDEDGLILWGPGQFRVIDAVLAKNSLRGRFPDGTGRWLRPSLATPGLANQFNFHDDVVINEIMYHAPLLPEGAGVTDRESPEAWIELYNKGAEVVDLTGWELGGGVSFAFPLGTTIASGDYLVIADDAAFMRAKYPAVTILGNLGGRLSGRSDRIELNDPVGNPADEVEYFDSGAWPDYADGGGSSLELKDPLADNSKAEAWADSDETGDGSWQTYTYRKVAGVPSGSGQPTNWRDFVFGLLGAGECLVDDISVVETPDTTPIEVIGNGDFESGLSGWRVIGTHGGSRIVPDPDDPGNSVLRVVATGPQEHMHNHIETTLAGGRSIANGREYEVTFRARWLAGNNLLNTRLYFNRVAQSTSLPIAEFFGSPGAPNGSLVVNHGPTFDELQHSPVIPQPSQPVTVSVQANDPQGIATINLNWSVNGGSWVSAPMTQSFGDGYTGSIPGQSSGAIVQFYVSAEDGSAAGSDFPAAGPDSGALYAVADGQADLNLGHNFRIVLTPSNTSLLHAFTNVQSNAKLPGTVIYDEQRAYYNVGVRLKGSERGRFNDTRVSFHLTFPPDDHFRGVHPVMLVDRSGAGDSGSNKQQEILIKQILYRAGDIPVAYADMTRVIAPRSNHTGPSQLLPRFEDEFIETAYSNGSDGNIWELELIYYPTTANAFGYKNPSPDSVIGTDIRDLGDDKEIYRYNFIIKKDRDADNYDPFITMAKTWSLAGDELETQTRSVMDIDAWMRTWAAASLCGVGDTYTWGNNHNLLMYLRPSDNRFVPFPWDMDFSFNRGSGSALIGDQNLSDIIRLDSNERRFYGHVKEIISSSYNTAYMNRWINHYDDFAPGQNYSAVSTYITQRSSSAMSQINSAGGNAAFAVSGGTSLSVEKNLVTLTGTAPVDVQYFQVNGVEVPVTWTSMSGWTLWFPVAPGTNDFQLVGLDAQHQPLATFTADLTVEFDGSVPEADDFLVINEIMYNPEQPGASYVEILNSSDSVSFDISGWRINGVNYEFPEGSFITNGQQLAIAEGLQAFGWAYGGFAPEPFDVFDGALDLDGETLTLQKPVTQISTNGMGMTETNIAFVDVNRVRYEPAAPWNATANGGGAALQLIDPSRDNSRVSNWSDGKGWRQLSFTAQAGSGASRLFLWLDAAGEVFLDNIELVMGDTPGVGPNVLVNGGFESGDLTQWTASGNHSNSVVTTEESFEGTHSLKIIATGPGSAASAILQAFATLPSTETYTLSFYFLPNTAELLNYRVSSFFRTLTGLDVSARLATPGFLNTSTGVLPAYDALWLNEVLPLNTGGLLDNQGEVEPWIELFNAGDAPISLDNYFLADNYKSNLAQWVFPSGSEILPGEFKLVIADGEPGESTTEEWHANFRPTVGAGSLALVRLTSGPLQITDYLNYTNLLADQSYGDFPDGQPFKRVVFNTTTPGMANNARPADIYINEWQAGTQTSLADPADGNFEDWFELYNAGNDPVELTGYYLTDDLDDKTQFQIPAGYVIPAQGFLLVWADNDSEQNTTNSNQIHVNFALNRDGESIGLYSPDRIAVDEIIFGIQSDEISEGRFPDGAAEVFALNPTPLAANEIMIDPGVPVIMDLELLQGGELTFSFATEIGQFYRVDYKNDLNDADWTPLTISIAGTGDLIVITDDISLQSQRFYRVVIE